ncbi:putative translation initiation factor IF-2, partial [Trichinella spiralis]|uniref:putative translation initiation factor IF-2 n=1 Tax=Trichinella spiralis TaxID=6334 RepID=UPI0001EFE74D
LEGEGTEGWQKMAGQKRAQKPKALNFDAVERKVNQPGRTGRPRGDCFSNADYKVALNRLRKEFDRPVKLIRHQIRKLVQAPPKDVGLRLQYDYLRGTIDALTALGKDPMKGGLREGELSAAEITIAISRNGLLTPVRIKWDEKTQRPMKTDCP